MSGADPRAGLRWQWPVLAVVATALTFARTRSIGFVGYDNYPILIASRVRSWSDFVGTFTESLMDGRYPGDFYRPLLNLSFATDHALWGLRADGFQATNALWFVACAWALHLLARRVQGDGGRVHWLAPLVFLLHPAAVEVVPAASRRAETLCGTFLALSVAVALVGRGSGGRRRFVAGGLAALAIGAKETGYLAPILVFGVVAICGSGPAGGRLLRAAQRALPAAVAAVLLLTVRFVVLGHLGGHRELELGGASALGIQFLGSIVTSLATATGEAASWRATVLVGAGIGATVFLLLRPRRRTPDPADAALPAGALRLLWCGALWAVLPSLPYALAGRLAAWYVLLPAMGWAMVLAGLAGLAAAAWRAPASDLRRLGIVALVAWTVGVTAQARCGLWMQGSGKWRTAASAATGFLDRLAARIAETPDGSILETEGVPRRIRVPREHFELGDMVYVISGYSVQAWAELEYPDRRIRVRDLGAKSVGSVGAAPPIAAPDELLIVLPRVRVNSRSPAPEGAPPVPRAPTR